GDRPIEEVYVYPLAEPPFEGFGEIKRRYPSAEVISIIVFGGREAGKVFDRVRPLIGKVNGSEFEGKAPETLLLLGPRGSSAEPTGKIVFVHRPEGWNTLYRNETKSWERVVYSGTGKPIYEPAEFGPLAEIKIANGARTKHENG